MCCADGMGAAGQGLDKLYAGRPLQRFWFLETVARMPYFSYISMLHLYESLGWWRAGAELRRVRVPGRFIPHAPASFKSLNSRSWNGSSRITCCKRSK